ncbi:hypothetical protein GALL_417490 [mine drainage metagenome]|uniref:Uncharacterized protein n=1 Tax=mine drainage metagenome TaxID=410659 RepID=A0A1J5QGD5_9ZZZZ
MTRSGTEAGVVIMRQKIGYVFLTIKCGDFKVGFASIDCRLRQRRLWHIPAEPGPGSGRPTGACWAVSPHSGNDPLRDG